MKARSTEYIENDEIHGYNKAPEVVGSYSRVLDNFILALREFRGSSKLSVLDLGAGTGIYSDYLSRQDLDVTAMDPSKNAMKATQVHKIYSTLEAAKLPSQSLDGIHIKDAIVHVPRKDNFIKECKRVLKPKGVMVCVFDEVSKRFEIELRHSGSLPYYATSLDRLMELCKEESINMDYSSVTSWTPENDEKDWYEGQVTRFVATGVKS